MATRIGPFEGFPKELPDFLWGIALNNEKPWFEARRDIYERCLHGPMKALAYAVCEALNERYPRANLLPHVSRIYRDARTLNGRGPLNDHMWFSLGRTGRVYEEEPQFFFGIDARCVDRGLGFWNMGAERLERWRRGIDEHPQSLSRIVRGVNKLPAYDFMGDVYKRPKGDPGPLLYDWYNTRHPGVRRVDLFDPDPPGAELAGRLIEEFSLLMPLYEYFLAV